MARRTTETAYGRLQWGMGMRVMEVKAEGMVWNKWMAQVRCSAPSYFFFNYTAPPEIYPLSLHDALPICAAIPSTTHSATHPTGALRIQFHMARVIDQRPYTKRNVVRCWRSSGVPEAQLAPRMIRGRRSEEHTSELQSQSNLVCRLLLDTK